MFRKTTLAVAVLCAGLMAAAGASGQAFDPNAVWTGLDNASWFDKANWNPARDPNSRINKSLRAWDC